MVKCLGRNKNRQEVFECICDCGKTVPVTRGALNATGSCGCSRKTHGLSRVRDGKGSYEYRVWACMLNRCGENGEKNYKGRGIKVCERWKDFANFIADMGERPSPQHSIDRIDNDGDYCPENCRWATKAEQDRNKRTNRNVTYKGVTKCITDWAQEVGLHPAVITYRLDHGWSVEKAMETPSRRKK